MKLLIVEDEPKTAAYLKKGLEENGFMADVAGDGETGAYMARQSGYELVILDVMLPGQNGWPVLREMRQRRNRVPVLFLTARDGVPDRVCGLELGADDYLIKPFAFSELLARLQTSLRRDGVGHGLRSSLRAGRGSAGASGGTAGRRGGSVDAGWRPPPVRSARRQDSELRRTCQCRRAS